MPTAQELKVQQQKGVIGVLIQPELNEPYLSPRPVSRVGTSQAAADNVERNRGSISLWLKSEHNRNYSSPRQTRGIRATSDNDLVLMDRNKGQTMEKIMDRNGNQNYFSSRCSRVVGSEGQDNLRRSYGTMENIMKVEGNHGFSDPQPKPKLQTKEAEDNAARNCGTMKKLLDLESQSSRRVVPLQPRVKGEAQDNYAKGKGSMSAVFDESMNSSQNYSVEVHEPRVKPEAKSIAEMSRGMCALVMAGKVSGDTVPDARVKGEGKEIYDKSSGTMNQLQYSYGKLPASGRPQPKVKGDGADIAEHGNRGTVGNLFQKYGNLPNSARPAARVRSSGKRFANKNRGTMSLYLTRK